MPLGTNPNRGQRARFTTKPSPPQSTDEWAVANRKWPDEVTLRETRHLEECPQRKTLGRRNNEGDKQSTSTSAVRNESENGRPSKGGLARKPNGLCGFPVCPSCSGLYYMYITNYRKRRYPAYTGSGKSRGPEGLPARCRKIGRGCDS